MKQQIHHESDTRSLSTVAVLDFSHAPEILLHRQSLTNHGAVMIPNTSIGNIKDVVQQKIAVIVDQSVGPEEIEKLIIASDTFIEKNPDMSLRIFYLYWSGDTATTSGPRLRGIDATKVAAHDLPIHINRSLYKARLPYFLRKGYDIDISHKLKNIDGEYYREITMKKHLQSEIESAAEYSDKTHYVFVSDKKIQKMYKVTEEGRLEYCEWDEEKTQLPHTVNIKGYHGLYSKEHNRFYRIDSEYDVSELNPQKTRPGKIDYTSIGLMIHNKELFTIDAKNQLVTIDENGYIPSQKYNSGTPPGLLPIATYKSSEDEE